MSREIPQPNKTAAIVNGVLTTDNKMTPSAPAESNNKVAELISSPAIAIAKPAMTQIQVKDERLRCIPIVMPAIVPGSPLNIRDGTINQGECARGPEPLIKSQISIIGVE